MRRGDPHFDTPGVRQVVFTGEKEPAFGHFLQDKVMSAMQQVHLEGPSRLWQERAPPTTRLLSSQTPVRDVFAEMYSTFSHKSSAPAVHASLKAFCATEAANAPADDVRALWASEVRKYARVCALFDVDARLRADMEWVERRWLRGGGYERTLSRWGFSTWLHEGAGERAVALQLYPWVRVSAAAVLGSEWTEWELGWLRLVASMPATVERVQLRDLTAADGRLGAHALLGMRLVQHIKCLLAKQRPGCEVEVVRQHEERPLALGL
ncbi:hypothetical protein SLS56_004120 [Neofusicoccum ribis]|uniref:Uncharacterized protein n=1 Tax=Neofusicoccum ribis TaxID=45134 RepID=A0ABR3SX39_9PEZI